MKRRSMQEVINERERRWVVPTTRCPVCRVIIPDVDWERARHARQWHADDLQNARECRRHRRGRWRSPGGVAVKARPIIFGADSVRAILGGLKTQTRRVVTRANSYFDGSTASASVWGDLDFGDAFFDHGPSPAGNPGPYLKVASPKWQSRHRIYPRWQPGDRLWCKETWHRDQSGGCFGYYADFDAPSDSGFASNVGGGKVSPLFMPRWASRITLEITRVRVERLQEITEDDAQAEGCELDTEPCDHTRQYCEDIGCMGQTSRSTFCGNWERLNAKRGFRWETNPWVWVVEFKRVAS